MSTRSHIGLLQADGTVLECYCHYDSYQNGPTLVQHYQTVEKVNQLLIAEIRSLDPNGTPEYFSDSNDPKVWPSEGRFLEACTEDYTFLFKHDLWYERQWSRPFRQISPNPEPEDPDDENSWE